LNQEKSGNPVQRPYVGLFLNTSSSLYVHTGGEN
jgi:hypothetical protein